MFNTNLSQPVAPLNELNLLKIIQASEHGMTVTDLVADLKAHRWDSTTQLYRHFGFTVRQGHSFVNGLCWFLGRERLLSHGNWMRCFR